MSHASAGFAGALALAMLSSCGATVDSTLSAIGSVQGRGGAPARPCSGDPLAAAGILGVSLDGVPEVLFVLEASGAMQAPVPCAPGGPAAFEVARAGLRQGLERLPGGTRFDVVIAHGNEPRWLWHELHPLDEATRQEAIRFVDAATCDNQAFMGMYTLTSAVRESTRLLYLGAGNPESSVGWDVLLSYARGWGEQGIRFDVVALGTLVNEDVMRQLATRTSGRVVLW